MTDDKQRIEYAKWLFERTLGWIATADVKVGVAMALDTAMLGGLATAFGTSDPQLRTAWCYFAVLTAVGAMVIAMFCAGMAAIPRMLGPVKSMIFFARIKEQSTSDYVAQFSQLTEHDLLTDLTTQIHRNAEIAAEKHWWVRKSLIWSFLGAIPWVAAIGMLVKV
ncbi:Pycsar system effector family protein [Acidovorax sp.]|uniref:Pycsar system effector family protein n=1 Tax=Acidovorax sp. TaxID=1872122 RepID=UPI0031CE2630